MNKVVIVILFFVSVLQGNYEAEILQRDIQVTKGMIQVWEQNLRVAEDLIYANKWLIQIDEQNIQLAQNSNTLIQLEQQMNKTVKDRLPALKLQLESLSQIYQLFQLHFGLVQQAVENFQREIQIYQDEIYESQRDIREYQIATKNNLNKTTQLQAKIQDLQQRIGSIQEISTETDTLLPTLKEMIERIQRKISNSRTTFSFDEVGLKKTAKLTANEIQQLRQIFIKSFLEEIQIAEEEVQMAQGIKTSAQVTLQQQIRELQMAQQELKKIKK